MLNQNDKKVKFTIAGMLLLFALVLFAFKPASEEYKVDVKSSTVQWTGYHLAKSYEHTGFVSLKSGKLIMDNGKLVGGNFVLDMNSITNTDLEDKKKNAKLVGHLKSDDFFNTGKFPTSMLEIKSATPTGNNNYSIKADLTIRGISKPIEFDALVKMDGNGKVTADSKFNVERSQYEVMYGWSVENAMLDGEFTLEVKLSAMK